MQVMFVDDESRVLSGIERAFMLQDSQWEFRFATSGPEALTMLGETPADVVISDMRMPFMDGAELLSQVRERWPGTIRIILSGYSDPDSTQRMLDVAHRLVSKPCDSSTLSEIIENAFALRTLFPQPWVLDCVGRITHLPAAPDIFMQVQHLLENAASNSQQIAELLGRDPALSAKIMQLANSAWFCKGSPVYDIASAITLLGVDRISLLVMTSHARVEAQKASHPSALQRTAFLASALAAHIVGHHGLESTAALLANVAQLIPEISETDEPVTTRDDTSPLAAVGAYLLAMWGLPLEIVEIVAGHDNPARFGHNTFGAAGVVHVAVALANHRMPDSDYLATTGMLNQLPLWQQTFANLQETLYD
ncbi:HDOD domain-containing protein [Enterobacter sp. Bisph1]|uniref:HDOD domain-containing protein n=1 Tax=Enterobacter sp. Bisph1 TaxID=1274399 RepID=UPI00057C0079|nr:HDOD domain-containing protein [Enterobacter sp. Bisph1]